MAQVAVAAQTWAENQWLKLTVLWAHLLWAHFAWWSTAWHDDGQQLGMMMVNSLAWWWSTAWHDGQQLGKAKTLDTKQIPRSRKQSLPTHQIFKSPTIIKILTECSKKHNWSKVDLNQLRQSTELRQGRGRHARANVDNGQQAVHWKISSPAGVQLLHQLKHRLLQMSSRNLLHKGVGSRDWCQCIVWSSCQSNNGACCCVETTSAWLVGYDTVTHEKMGNMKFECWCQKAEIIQGKWANCSTTSNFWRQSTPTKSKKKQKERKKKSAKMQKKQ